MTYDSPFPTSNANSNHAATLFLHVLAGNSGMPPAPAGVQAAAMRTEQAQVGRLIHCGQTIERLKDESWYINAPASLNEQLDPTTVSAILLRLYENGSTGVLTARNRQGQQRCIALVGGTAVGIASLNLEDRLGTYLVESGRLDVDVAKQAMQLMQKEEKPLGWALLKTGAISSSDLLRSLQTHAEQTLMGMFGWADGEVQFREVAQTVDLRRVIDTPFLALIRQAYAHIYRQDGATLRSFTAPFFQRDDPLALREVPPRLETLIEGVHPGLLECARKGGTPSGLANVMKPHDATQFNRDLADIYVLTHLGFLGFAKGTAKIRLASIPASFHHADGPPSGSTADPLATYRQQQETVATAKRALHNFNPTEAANRLAQLVRESSAEPPLEALAYLGIALALLGDKERSMEFSLRALKRQPSDALAHAAICRAFEVAGNTAQANYHHKNALALSEKNPEWYTEVTAALKLQPNQQARAAAAVTHSTVGRAFPLWMLVIAVYLVLFALANVMRMGGAREYFYAWDEPFFYIRRLTLLVVGVAGWCVWRGQSPVKLLQTTEWKVPWVWVGRIALYGAVVGLLSPAQRVTGDVATVSMMCLLHVLCEEVFFRGFITNMLYDQIADKTLPVLASALLYGLYHWTYYSFWMEAGPQVKIFYLGLITAFAGVPYALMLRMSKTLTAPLVCHASVHLVMMWFSIFRRH